VASIEQYALQSRDERLRRLARTGDELGFAIAACDSAQLARRPAPDAWAGVEVVCHLRDTEEWFLARCQMILRMDEPRFPRSNPDRWARERQYLRHDARHALAAFRRRREETIEFFAGLVSDAWERGGVHLDSRGRRTIDEFLSVMAWHDDNHLDQLRRALTGQA
jgi:hypothetical protein